MTLQAETVAQLEALAREGESFAAFKSTARACGLTAEAAEQIYARREGDAGDVELDVRESGAELRDGETWLTSTAVARVER